METPTKTKLLESKAYTIKLDELRLAVFRMREEQKKLGFSRFQIYAPKISPLERQVDNLLKELNILVLKNYDFTLF